MKSVEQYGHLCLFVHGDLGLFCPNPGMGRLMFLVGGRMLGSCGAGAGSVNALLEDAISSPAEDKMPPDIFCCSGVRTIGA